VTFDATSLGGLPCLPESHGVGSEPPHFKVRSGQRVAVHLLR